jgi:hypothetical protein
MALLRIKEFSGIAPRYESRKVPQQAQNVDLLSTALDPLASKSTARTVAAGTKSSYYYRCGDGTWEDFSTFVDVVRAPKRPDQTSTTQLFYYLKAGALYFRACVNGVLTASALSAVYAPTAAPELSIDELFDPSADLSCLFYAWSVTEDAGAYSYANAFNGTALQYVKHQWEGQILYVTYMKPAFNVLLGSTEADWLNAGTGDSNPMNVAAFPKVAFRFTTKGETFTVNTSSPVIVTTAFDAYDGYAAGPPVEGTLVATAAVVNYQASGTGLMLDPPDGVDVYSPAQQITFAIRFDWACPYTRTYHYRYSWVDQWGQESVPSPISDVVVVRPGYKVTISRSSTKGILETVTDHAELTQLRLYRSRAGFSDNPDAFFRINGGASAEYTLVGTKTNFVDLVGEGGFDADDRMPKIEAPPSGMDNLVVMPNGYAAAFYGKTVRFSEVGHLNSYPEEYRVWVDYNVVGLSVSGNDLVVMTEGPTYIVSGSAPDRMTGFRLPFNQACVAKAGIVTWNGAVCYPSNDGYCIVQGGQAHILTGGTYSPAQWRALTPSTCIAGVHNDMLLAYMTGVTLCLRRTADGIQATTTSESWTGIYYDVVDDKLYVISSTTMSLWEGSATKMTLAWKSPVYHFDGLINWQNAQVYADSYPVTLKLYRAGSGTASATITVSSTEAFRLAKIQPAEDWQIEVQNDDRISEIALATSMRELR